MFGNFTASFKIDAFDTADRWAVKRKLLMINISFANKRQANVDSQIECHHFESEPSLIVLIVLPDSADSLARWVAKRNVECLVGYGFLIIYPSSHNYYFIDSSALHADNILMCFKLFIYFNLWRTSLLY